jgi:hypothetical protein
MQSARSKWLVAACGWRYGIALLAACAFTWIASAQSSLPSALSAAEAASLSQMLSEPQGPFFSDNLVSNELSFLQVLPELSAKGTTGHAYIGVGPEQNFSFMSVLKPRIAFVIDIRRNNLLLLVFYNAVFKLSPTRGAFVFRLFSREVPTGLDDLVSAQDLMDAAAHAGPLDRTASRQHLGELMAQIRRDQVTLTSEDINVIGHINDAFATFGPQIDYAASALGRSLGVATYGALMTQMDTSGHTLGFLADDAAYGAVRDLELRNLVVPVTGNVAGTHALRAIGDYLREHGATVSAFYISNVEDYLSGTGFRNGEWSTFCENVAHLPLDPGAVFIRPWGLAVAGPEGSILVRPDMTIGTVRGNVVLPPGSPVPSALTLMADQTKTCH